MATKSKKIIFTASMGEVKSLASGKIRIFLDIPGTDIFQVAKLMECKRNRKSLSCSIIPGKQATEVKAKKTSVRRIIKTPYYNKQTKR